MTETADGITDTVEYTYNTIGYLTEVKKNGTTSALYEYDQNGNRTAYIADGDTTIGVYDDQDRLLSYGSAQYVYGLNGDLRKKIEGTDTTKYDYDNMGNLRTVILPNSDVIEYVINANNQRIAKIKNGVIEKKWLYSGGLLPVAEVDSSDEIKVLYGPGYIVKGDTTYRVITNHLGSVKLIVNASTGEIVQNIDYDEFGNISSLLNENEFTDFGFAGGIYDTDTKLVRFGARDYNPEIGRWTAKDPIGFGGGQSNFYKYCLNDPVNRVDPSGLDALKALSHFFGVGSAVNETMNGLSLMVTSGGLAIFSGGMSFEVSGPGIIGGGALALHGLYATGTNIYNASIEIERTIIGDEKKYDKIEQEGLIELITSMTTENTNANLTAESLDFLITTLGSGPWGAASNIESKFLEILANSGSKTFTLKELKGLYDKWLKSFNGCK